MVDGDAETRDRLTSVLSEAGLDPVTAADAESGLAAARRRAPALVLLEADLPGAGKLEVLEELRARPETAHVPVLVLTGASVGEDSDMERAFEMGADDFLRKPVRFAELMARIRNHLRLRQSVEELARKEGDAKVMLELTQALASSLDFREILYTVVRRIADFVDVERVSIVIAPEPEQEDVGYVVVASDDEELSNLKLDLNEYPEIQKVLRTRQPLTIEDVATHPLLDVVREKVKQSQHSSMSLFPIVWEDKAIGVLFLRAQAPRGALSGREAHFCQIVANATAVALRNARVMQSLRDHTQQATFARAEAEQRLRSLKRYADLFASAAEGIAVIDAGGRLLFANPWAYELTGYDEAALEGRKVRELVHPDDTAKMREMWEGFSTGQFPRGVDVRMVRKDGQVITANCSFASLLDGEGAVLLSFRDVTEERETEAELKKTKEFLESLINASVDGIIAADMDGRIVLFNKGAERIYGYSADEAIGKMNVRELYQGNTAREVMKMLRSDKHGGPGRLGPIRLDVVQKTGEEVPIQLSAAIIYENGRESATFGIFTDLRERIRVEERLAQAQQKLAVTEKQALLAELAGTAAHELNQPLTSVMAYAAMLQRKLEEGSAEYQAAEMMSKEAERMAEIVKKIGKMTKYETKSYVGDQRILDLDKAGGPDSGRTAGK
ncbi:MAG: PAS domain S-box protein [Polyangiales bacterium]